jgi:hypothetical protein
MFVLAPAFAGPAVYAARMLRRLAGLSAAALWACQASAPPPEEPGGESGMEPAADRAAAAADEDCSFQLEGACFPDADSACKAAGCSLDTCEILYSFPPQVACQPATEVAPRSQPR